MANELQAQTPGRTGLVTAFSVTDGDDGTIWNGTTFASYSTANFKAGAIAATGRADGSYFADMPAGINSARNLVYRLFYVAGGAPVTTNIVEADQLLAGPNAPRRWSGATWVTQTGDAYTAAAAIPTAAQNADKLIGRNIAGGSDGGRTVKDALAASRNKVAFDVPTAGSFTVYDTDDTTPLWVGTYSRGANTLGPLTDVDPS